MENSEPTASLPGTKVAAGKSRWLADIPDLLILLCSCALSGVSLFLVHVIFHVTPRYQIPPWLPQEVPHRTLSILQRVISALSATITSAVIVVLGKRYVLYRMEIGGIRSRGVALYNRPTVVGLALHLVRHGPEFPLLILFAAWALGLATGLTVDDACGMAPAIDNDLLAVPFGSLDGPLAPEIMVLPAFEQLSNVMGSLCLGVAGVTGVINITGGMQLASGGQSGVVFYPPLPGYTPNSAFNISAQLNAFNISVEPISSVPQTAQRLTCIGAIGTNFTAGDSGLWYDGGDNQTLSIIAQATTNGSYRLNASAIIIGGILHSTGSNTEFVWNGTTWPNVMSSNQWGLDIATLICNVTRPVNSCNQFFAYGSSGFGEYTTNGLVNFAMNLNSKYSSSFNPYMPTGPPVYWSTVLGMAMGAYSSNTGTFVQANATHYGDLHFTPRYGVYVLIANVVVSLIMVFVAVGLRMASHLGADFIDATRLLMDPLKDSELYNASLDATINACGNPRVIAKDGEIVLRERKGTND